MREGAAVRNANGRRVFAAAHVSFVGVAVGLPFAPLTFAALFVLTMRRGLKPAANGERRLTLATKIKDRASLSRQNGDRDMRSARFNSAIGALAREARMAAAPGKSCGACTMCCSALEIAHFKKPAGPLCVNCRLGGRVCNLRRAP